MEKENSSENQETKSQASTSKGKVKAISKRLTKKEYLRAWAIRKAKYDEMIKNLKRSREDSPSHTTPTSDFDIEDPTQIGKKSTLTKREVF